MRSPGSHVSGHVPHTLCVSQDEAREVYEAQRDEISSLSLPPARELRDYHKELWIRFGKEETATIRRIDTVQERLRQQQEALRELESHQHLQPGAPTQPTKIEKIRFLTREIQNTLKKVNAWNKGQLDGLERSQNSLEEELEVIEKALANTKIDKPSEDTNVNQNSVSNSDNGESENCDEIDVDNVIQEDFHTWVSRTGGHNGGWSAEDHLYMVTLTHRHANWRRLPDRFLEEIWSGVRAVSTREAVRRHVLWYAEYCVRRDRQRLSIGQWRERRAAAKVEERRNSATSMKLHKTNKSGWLHKNKEKLRKLEEWKRLKTVKKEIEEAEELLRVAEKKSKIEQRMERRNTQIKRYLKVREEKKKVQQRREEEEKRIKELERKHRREMNRMVLSQYHEKDMERIQWKVKQKADEQAKREEQKRHQLERLQRPVQARRELDTALRSTMASASRERSTREGRQLTSPGHGGDAGAGGCNTFRGFPRRRSLDYGDLYHLHNLPKLSTPAWRTLV